jgi:hypothetical protein
MDNLLGYIISGFVSAGVITLLAHFRLFPMVAIFVSKDKI